MLTREYKISFFGLLAIWLCLSGCCGKLLASESQAAPTRQSDSELNLLVLAFESACKMPLEPHIKTRSRLQEQVISQLIEMDQADLALVYSEKIKNWRRGVCLADLAYYHAKNGKLDKANELLAEVKKISASAQDWRRDSIRVKIAQVYALMGADEKAGSYQRGVVDNEQGKVMQINALSCDRAEVDSLLAQLDAQVATGTYELIVNALTSYSNLYKRFYEDSKLRNLIEEKIEKAWDTVPFTIRIETLTNLAKSAVEHEDKPRAIELSEKAAKYVLDARWPIRYRIPLLANLASLKFQVGDIERANELADESLKLFEAEGESIINIYRARALCPLGEAYELMGKSEKANSVYTLAATQAVVNPNSRPRTEDLTAICCSMAAIGVEPDAELWAKLRKISEDLGQPW